nr:PREDICTED: antigen KI-67 isoform X3 [Latimeria chalumnae]|eukprot:XP_014343792.1 PREDICTED: antigen KI-67 isoform X3 [Latimeria chalumnae]
MPLYGKIVVIKRTGADGTHFPLTATSCLFGRKTECDIRIQLPHVSKEHCKIEVNENKEVILTNLSTVNPARLNGNIVQQPERLSHGDVFTIIDRSFRFEYPPESTPRKRRPSLSKKETLQQVAEEELQSTEKEQSSSLISETKEDGKEVRVTPSKRETTPKRLHRSSTNATEKQKETTPSKSPFGKLYEMLKIEAQTKPQAIYANTVTTEKIPKPADGSPKKKLSLSVLQEKVSQTSLTPSYKSRRESQLKVEERKQLEYKLIPENAETQESITSEYDFQLSVPEKMDVSVAIRSPSRNRRSSMTKQKVMKEEKIHSADHDVVGDAAKVLVHDEMVDIPAVQSPERSGQLMQTCPQQAEQVEAVVNAYQSADEYVIAASSSNTPKKNRKSSVSQGNSAQNTEVSTKQNESVKLLDKITSEVGGAVQNEVRRVASKLSRRSQPVAPHQFAKCEEKQTSEEDLPDFIKNSTHLTRRCFSLGALQTEKGKKTQSGNWDKPSTTGNDDIAERVQESFSESGNETKQKHLQRKSLNTEQVLQEVQQELYSSVGRSKKKLGITSNRANDVKYASPVAQPKSGRLHASSRICLSSNNKGSETLIPQEVPIQKRRGRSLSPNHLSNKDEYQIQAEKTANQPEVALDERKTSVSQEKQVVVHLRDALDSCNSSPRKYSGKTSMLKAEDVVSEIDITAPSTDKTVESVGLEGQLPRKRKSGEQEKVFSEPPVKKKRVSFGGHLSPELFDKRLPPNSPLRKGATPVRLRLGFESTPCAVLKRVSLGRKSSMIKEFSEYVQQAQSPRKNSVAVSPAGGTQKRPSTKEIMSPACRSPGVAAKTPLPACRSPGVAAKTPLPARRSPGVAAKTPSPACRSPGAAAKTPSPAHRSFETSANASETLKSQPLTLSFSKKCTADMLLIGKGSPFSRSSQLVVEETPSIHGRFSVSHISTPPPVWEQDKSGASSDHNLVSAEVKQSELALNIPNPIRLKSMLLASSRRSQRKSGAFETLQSGRKSGASQANLLAAKSWADIVRLGKAQSQGKIVVKKPGLRMKVAKKKSLSRTLKQTPVWNVKGFCHTGHADSPATIVIGRAHAATIEMAGKVPRVVKNVGLKYCRDMNESFTGMAEMFSTPVSEKQRKSPRLSSGVAGSKIMSSSPAPITEVSSLNTPEEFGKMMIVSPLSIPGNTQHKMSFEDDASLVNKKVPAFEDMVDKRIVKISRGKKETEIYPEEIKNLRKTPKQKIDQVEDLAGVKNLRKTPKQKIEQVEDLTVIKQIMSTREEKLIKVKRLLQPSKQIKQMKESYGEMQLTESPTGKVQPLDKLINIMLKGPENITTVENIKEPKEVEHVENRVEIGQMKTPEKNKQALKNLEKIKTTMKTRELLEDMVGVKRHLRTPRHRGQPENDIVDISKLVTTPMEETKPVQDMVEGSKIMRTSKPKLSCSEPEYTGVTEMLESSEKLTDTELTQEMAEPEVPSSVQSSNKESIEGWDVDAPPMKSNRLRRGKEKKMVKTEMETAAYLGKCLRVKFKNENVIDSTVQQSPALATRSQGKNIKSSELIKSSANTALQIKDLQETAEVTTSNVETKCLKKDPPVRIQRGKKRHNNADILKPLPSENAQCTQNSLAKEETVEGYLHLKRSTRRNNLTKDLNMHPEKEKKTNCDHERECVLKLENVQSEDTKEILQIKEVVSRTQRSTRRNKPENQVEEAKDAVEELGVKNSKMIKNIKAYGIEDSSRPEKRSLMQEGHLVQNVPNITKSNALFAESTGSVTENEKENNKKESPALKRSLRGKTKKVRFLGDSLSPKRSRGRRGAERSIKPGSDLEVSVRQPVEAQSEKIITKLMVDYSSEKKTGSTTISATTEFQSTEEKLETATVLGPLPSINKPQKGRGRKRVAENKEQNKTAVHEAYEEVNKTETLQPPVKRSRNRKAIQTDEAAEEKTMSPLKRASRRKATQMLTATNNTASGRPRQTNTTKNKLKGELKEIFTEELQIQSRDHQVSSAEKEDKTVAAQRHSRNRVSAKSSARKTEVDVQIGETSEKQDLDVETIEEKTNTGTPLKKNRRGKVVNRNPRVRADNIHAYVPEPVKQTRRKYPAKCPLKEAKTNLEEKPTRTSRYGSKGKNASEERLETSSTEENEVECQKKGSHKPHDTENIVDEAKENTGVTKGSIGRRVKAKVTDRKVVQEINKRSSRSKTEVPQDKSAVANERKNEKKKTRASLLKELTPSESTSKGKRETVSVDTEPLLEILPVDSVTLRTSRGTGRGKRVMTEKQEIAAKKLKIDEKAAQQKTSRRGGAKANGSEKQNASKQMATAVISTRKTRSGAKSKT